VKRSGPAALRYDACIIGAGAEGLACAAWLAGHGLKVLVAEREAQAGGRCTTREFVPGFRASPYCDEVPAIPIGLFRAFDLARRGAILFRAERPLTAADGIREAVIGRVMADAATPPPRGLFRTHVVPQPWPGEQLADPVLAKNGAGHELLPAALCDTALAGSALVQLLGPPGGLPLGGLGRLGRALRTAAEEAGAEISCGLEVTDIRRRRGRVVAAGLADGSEIAARAIVSTMDLKRTFLSQFAWNELPKSLVERVGAFRAAPGIARLLVALDAPPEVRDPSILRRPIVMSAGAEQAYRAWRTGTIPENPPAVLRVVSAVDPFLAPDRAATLTLTLGGIPHSPFDGAWTHEKRNRLRDSALAIMNTMLPGTAGKVRAAELIVPPDIESQLGLSEGDLMGGELSPSQMLAFRPFPECRPPRTPVEGLYLAGPSSALGPLATCASGVAAARAVIADMSAGRLR
jgi:phytoene dehydrogenase-like protein